MSESQVRPISAQQNALVIKRSLEQMATQFRDALPSHITPEKFQRVVLTVVNTSPELAKADKTSLLSACMKCAADGLIPDGRDAALVVFAGRVQYMPMYPGIMRRARNSGLIASISAHVVYERDHFVYALGDEEAIEHKPAMGDRGKMIGVYAIARFKDGSIQREVMDATDVEKVRKASRSGNSGPWQQWPDQMWRKTAIRRLSKYLPLDADLDKIMREDEEHDKPARPEVVTLDGVATHGVDGFEAAALGITLEGEVETPPPSPTQSLIATIEQCDDQLALDKLQAEQTTRDFIKAADADTIRQINVAIEAQKRGFGRAG